MIDNISEDTWTLLEEEARRINSPAFIADDPVQFPRRFASQPDAEIASLLSATIAWGNRRMICRDCDRMLALMGHDPHAYVMDRAYEDLPDATSSAVCTASTPATPPLRSSPVPAAPQRPRLPHGIW